MNLYQALQGVLEKVRKTNDEVTYAPDTREMLRGVLDNQERLSEALLIVGGLLQALTERAVEFEFRPGKEEKPH